MREYVREYAHLYQLEYAYLLDNLKEVDGNIHILCANTEAYNYQYIKYEINLQEIMKGLNRYFSSLKNRHM